MDVAIRVVADPDEAKRILRRRMERAVEKLMAALDAMDGDSDLEEQHDREAVCEDEGSPTGDDEPWLGTDVPYGYAFDGEVLHSPVEVH